MHTVISAFDDRAAAQRAVEQLLQAGFDRGDVHLQDAGSADAAAGRQQVDGGGEGDRGVMSSFGHFFASLFGEDNPSGQADTYAEAVRRGSSVVVVDAEDESEARRASTLLRGLGAVDIDQREQEWRASGWTGAGAAQAPRDGKLDVVQEELQVGKREVEQGGVRIVQRMSQKPVREIVRLREEHAMVERHAVDRPASPADLDSFREGTMEVRERAEVPVVGKTARVVEEVTVGKEVREREETIEDTVRRKDVEVERFEGTGRTSAERERAVAAERESELNRTRPVGGNKPTR